MVDGTELAAATAEGGPRADPLAGVCVELADRAAHAVVNATSHELPALPGLETGVRYLPGAAGARIGGDWYDVFALPDGTVAFGVGDVMGHGVPAATAMGQMRASLRAHAFAGLGPGAILDRLDALVDQVDEMHLTTCVCATLDTTTGVVQLASAVLSVRCNPTPRRAAEDDRNGAQPSADASIALLLDRRSPARGRAFAREKLEQWDCQDVADDVALLTSELLLGEVATRWGADPTGGGKIVWFEVAL